MALGVSSADGVTTLPLKVDSSTGELLIVLRSDATPGTAPTATVMQHDQNYVSTVGAVNGSGVVVPLSVDSSTGELRVDVTT